MQVGVVFNFHRIRNRDMRILAFNNRIYVIFWQCDFMRLQNEVQLRVLNRINLLLKLL